MAALLTKGELRLSPILSCVNSRMRSFIQIVENALIREWADIDPVAEGLPLAMSMCAAQGYRKGWDGESEVGDDTEFREWCEKRLEAAYAEICGYIRGDTIKIYRAITLPEGETPDTSRHPGVCWTFDPEAIHPAHGRLGDHIWVFTAETTIDQIDWAQTLGQNVAPGYAMEKEIRLKDFGHVEMIDVSSTGEVK